MTGQYPLTPFSGDAPSCPKCGHRGASVTYLDAGRCAHVAGGGSVVIGFDPNPRLHRECTRCGYPWDEAVPKDQQTRPGSPPSTVWKYVVPVDDTWHDLTMPVTARVLHVACQTVDEVCVWAEVDPIGSETLPHRLRVFGTGQPIPSGARWWGTALAGPLVWHLYEHPETDS